MFAVQRPANFLYTLSKKSIRVEKHWFILWNQLFFKYLQYYGVKYILRHTIVILHKTNDFMHFDIWYFDILI
jgi:arginine/lysine/ornithine decarboxylase